MEIELNASVMRPPRPRPARRPRPRPAPPAAAPPPRLAPGAERGQRELVPQPAALLPVAECRFAPSAAVHALPEDRRGEGPAGGAAARLAALLVADILHRDVRAVASRAPGDLGGSLGIPAVHQGGVRVVQVRHAIPYRRQKTIGDDALFFAIRAHHHVHTTAHQNGAGALGDI